MQTTRLPIPVHWIWPLIWGAAVLLAPPTGTAKVSADMLLKKNVVALGETTALLITIEANDGEAISAPAIPEYKWAVVELAGQSHEQKFVYNSGKMSVVKSLQLTYRVTPLEPGQYLFENIRLSNGTPVEPVSITIMDSGRSPGSSQSPSPSPQFQTSPPPENKFGLSLIAELEKEEYYVGEEILLTYYLYYPMTTRDLQVREIDDSRNQFQGFWKEELDVQRQTQRIPGKTYSRAPILRYLLYPLTAGEQTIESIGLVCNVADRRTLFPTRFHSTEVQSRPLKLTIKELPQENQPEIFKGAVGQFRLDSRVDKNEVEEGNHVSLIIKLSGTGNIKNAPDPILPDLKKFDRFDPTKQEDIHVDSNGMSGTITYNYPLLPHDITAKQIGPVRFAYFDPDSEQYQTLKTNPISLNILPNTNPIQNGGFGSRRIITRIGDDFRFIETSTLALQNDTLSIYRNTGYWLWFTLGIVFLAGVSAMKWRLTYLHRNPTVAKSLSAPKQARRLLSEARRTIQSGETEQIYSQLGKAVTDYISNRWHLACAGMTSADLRQALPQKGVSNECAEAVIQLLEEFDAARFSGASYNPEQVQTDYQKTETLLNQLMNQKTNKA